MGRIFDELRESLGSKLSATTAVVATDDKKDEAAPADEAKPTDEAAPADEKKDEATEDMKSNADALGDIAKILDASEKVEMVLVRSNDQTDASWIVVNNMVPHAFIQLSDQDDADDIRAYFVTEKYKGDILRACRADKLGWERTLRSSKARLVSNGQLLQVSVDSADDIRKRTLREFSHAAKLVVAALSKNLLTDNPFKAAMYEAFKDANVARPQAAVERVFESGGEDLINTLIDKSFEWMNLSSESRDQLTDMIGGLSKKSIEASDDDNTNSDLARTLASNSVSLTTSGTKPAQDFRSQLRKAYGNQ